MPDVRMTSTHLGTAVLDPTDESALVEDATRAEARPPDLHAGYSSLRGPARVTRPGTIRPPGVSLSPEMRCRVWCCGIVGVDP